MSNSRKVQWRVHTPNLLKEVSNNIGAEILRQPIRIFGELLAEVGECAIRINDPELNALMMRLTIYSMADPESPDYNADAYDIVIKAAERAKRARLRKERPPTANNVYAQIAKLDRKIELGRGTEEDIKKRDSLKSLMEIIEQGSGHD